MTTPTPTPSATRVDPGANGVGWSVVVGDEEVHWTMGKKDADWLADKLQSALATAEAAGWRAGVEAAAMAVDGAALLEPCKLSACDHDAIPECLVAYLRALTPPGAAR